MLPLRIRGWKDFDDAKEIPIIAMTANAFAEDVEKANEVFYSKFLETINKMC